MPETRFIDFAALDRISALLAEAADEIDGASDLPPYVNAGPWQEGLTGLAGLAVSEATEAVVRMRLAALSVIDAGFVHRGNEELNKAAFDAIDRVLKEVDRPQ